MDSRSELADFLHSRRDRLTPDQAGLPEDGRTRRVPGLRRDEVARLAGVSTEYYTRLEQGRAGNPSPEVLAALSRALHLNASETEHLQDLLARPNAATRRAAAGPQRVRPGLHLMLQTLQHVPAYVLGRRTDVLAANKLARAVLTDFDALPVPARNLARYYLLDPSARQTVGDWERIAAETVGSPPGSRASAPRPATRRPGRRTHAAFTGVHGLVERPPGAALHPRREASPPPRCW